MPAVRRRLTLLAAALTASLAALILTSSQAGANALDKNGMWVWYVSASGGSPEAVAAKAVRHHIGTVFVKSGDAGNYWSQFSSDLVNTLHRRGVRVCAWQFVYGSNPLDEARVGARAAHAGADCLIIDAESSYEGRYGPADRYIRRLRSKVGGDYPLGLAGFPYVDYHPSFPYSVFLGRRGAKWNVPQMYWKTIGTSVQTIYEHTYLYNLPYDRRIYPLGQTWQDPGRTGITDFRKYAREYGGGGTSWWSWQETEGREWDWVGKRIHRGIPGFHARQLFPTLANGSRGDLVVLAQELLNAWRSGVKVDGSFGGGVEKHVMRFQRNHGLAQTGVITAPTWRVLRQRQPKWVFWGGHRHGKASTAPDSASDPALGYEIPPSVGGG